MRSRPVAASAIAAIAAIAAVAAAATMAAASAHAFGVLGHEVVAAIAMRHVDGADAATIRSLLREARIADGDPVRAAPYPDQYRIWNPESGPWHFVNVPLDAAEYSEDRDCHVDFQSRRVTDTPCVVAQIVSMKTRLSDSQLPARDRGLAAAMLIHFVADVHQPLHTVSNNDRGGNSVIASWFGETTNLHAVWDVKILEKRYGAGADPEPIAAALDASVTAEQRRAWCTGSSIDWANEGVSIARETVYRHGGGNPVVLDDAYYQRAWPVVDQRLARAGVRLACAIRGAFK
jgi:hypothetical protein